MIAKLKAAGAYAVVQHGPTWQDADTFLRKEVMVKVSHTLTPNLTYHV
jgi:L-serine/L-threonine ammonia-lyase